MSRRSNMSHRAVCHNVGSAPPPRFACCCVGVELEDWRSIRKSCQLAPMVSPCCRRRLGACASFVGCWAVSWLPCSFLAPIPELQFPVGHDRRRSSCQVSPNSSHPRTDIHTARCVDGRVRLLLFGESALGLSVGRNGETRQPKGGTDEHTKEQSKTRKNATINSKKRKEMPSKGVTEFLFDI